MIKGVIFDLDGVLVATDKLHYLAWKRLAQELGITDFTEKDNVRQRGVSRMASLQVVLEKTDRQYTAQEKASLAEKKNEYYIESLTHLTEKAILPNAAETVAQLREKNILIAVGSVSKNAPIILQRTGLFPLIDEVSCGLNITRSKPDPQVFLIAAEKLALKPEECLVVEDSDAGIQAAKAAGMKSLALGPAKKNPLADYHAVSLADSGIDWNKIIAL
ncbi:MAG: beta-phosphoglucomutase [Caproiciproducens sp.]|jgi:beta-phosphoglucomutase|nr:beta-phosphoglucomutase [Caproiciproducens sp.]